MKKITRDEIEIAALRSAENMGAPDSMHVPDPETGDFVYVDMKDPSPNAIEHAIDERMRKPYAAR